MTKSLTREELYELVWQKPLTEIAKEYGISDRGLSKMCIRLNIPLPSFGHWARVKAGKGEDKPELLIIKSLREDEPVLDYRGDENPNALPDDLKEFIKKEKSAENKIIVPEELSKYHHIIEDWNKRDRAVKIKIDKRASKVFSVFIEELEKRGFIVQDGAEDNGYIRVGTLKDMVAVWINRHYRRYKVEIPLEERRKDYFGNIQTYTFKEEQTNYLAICFNHKTFVESDEEPLENMLNKVVIYTARRLWAQKQNRLEREERDRIYELAEQRRNEEAKRQARIEELTRQEQAKIAELRQQTKNWVEAQNIRNYVNAIHKAGKNNMAAEELDSWKKWAMDYADELDPTVSL